VLQVVIDTNVLVAAIRSRQGASFHLLKTLEDGIWQPNISTALILEYEEVLRRESAQIGLPFDVAERIIDRFCAVGRQNQIYFRWRTHLPDLDDDFLLELAIRCNATFLITYNLHDLAPAAEFGIHVVTPGEFLRRIRV
jgi:putative PIN family toxin of toxin-antitoxin system